MISYTLLSMDRMRWWWWGYYTHYIFHCVAQLIYVHKYVIKIVDVYGKGMNTLDGQGKW